MLFRRDLHANPELAWAEARTTERVADRLHGVPAALVGYRRSLTEAAAAGVVATRSVVEEVVEQCRTWGSGEGWFVTYVAPYPGDGALGWVIAGVGGLMLGLLLALIVFGRRAQKAAYGQMEGQPGAAAAALQMLKRGW